MKKFKYFETESGQTTKTAQFKASELFGDEFKDVIINVTITEDGSLATTISSDNPTLIQKDILTETDNNIYDIDLTDLSGEVVFPIKESVIGEFTPSDKFIKFIGAKGNIKLTAEEATIDGKYLSGLGLDGIIFKLTICDNGTIDFVELNTNVTSKEQRQRLIDIMSEKTITPFQKEMVIPELKFESIKKIRDNTILLYLVVEYQKPIEKLASLFDDDDVDVEVIEISDEQSSKIDSLMSLFDDVDEEKEVDNTEVVEEVSEEIDAKKHMENSFAKMKEEKISELKNRLILKQKDLDKFANDIKMSKKKIEEAEGECSLLESRLETLEPQEPFIGYFFNVSERLNEKITLEPEVSKIIFDKISKVKSINAEAFMRLFEDGEYQIKIGIKEGDSIIELTDYKSLKDEAKERLSKLRVSIIDDKLVYNGDLTWGDITNKMVKLGFAQDSAFDKLCGSNSYLNKVEDVVNEIDTKKMENLKGFEEFDEDTKEQLEEFEEDFGYPMGDEFIFAASRQLHSRELYFSITPLSYWKNEGCCYDQHISDILEKKFKIDGILDELMESSFMFLDKDESELDFNESINRLCKMGIKPCRSFQDFIDSDAANDVMNTVEQFGYKNLIIA